MIFYLTIFLFTAFAFGGLYLFMKYPKLRRFLPTIHHTAEFISFSISYWGFKKHYSDPVEVAVKFTSLLRTLKLDSRNLADAKKQVAKFIEESYLQIYASRGKARDDKAEKVALASYTLLLSNEDIRDTVISLIKKNYKDLEVRKITLIAIDTFGELFTLENKLESEYFQHLIYAINKVLLLLRDSGTNKKNVKKIGAILFRLYKLTRAYKYLKGARGLTKSEFYAKFQEIIGKLPS